MKRVKIVVGSIVPSAEFKPMDRTVGQRIYESIVSHIPIEQSGVPIFDELPDKPSKDMSVKEENDYRLDNFDRAQRVIDYYGDKVDAIRVAREASGGGSGDTTSTDDKEDEGA